MVTKRRMASRALRWSGVESVAWKRRNRWSGVLVLTYHRVLPQPGPRYFGGVWSATPEGFAAQMELVARGCDVVDLADVPRLCNAPGRHVAITFDDGYRDNREHAFPVLRQHGIPATFFVTTGLVDGSAMPWWDEIAWLYGGLDHEAAGAFGTLDDVLRTYRSRPADRAGQIVEQLALASARGRLGREDVRGDWMSWDQVRDLRTGGMTIGAHTVSHPLLTRVDDRREHAEIADSADRIAEEVGIRPTVCAYPIGSRDAFDEDTKGAAQRAGMDQGYSLYGGQTTGGQLWDPYDIRRVGIVARHDLGDVSALLSVPQVFGRAAPPPPVSGSGSRPAAGLSPPALRGREKIRVVTLVDWLVHGGAERVAYQLTRELDPERFDRVLCVTAAGNPHHLAPGPEPEHWHHELRESGVRLLELDRTRRTDLRGWRPLLGQLRTTDVLHAHMSNANLLAATVGPLMRVPVTITHEHAFADAGGPVRAALDRNVVARGADAMIACSGAVRDRMVVEGRVPADRVVVVPNGVEGVAPTAGRDVRRELGIAPETPVVGSVGGLRRVKRFDVLVDAMALVRDIHPDAVLVIAGEGPDRQSLEAQIAERDLGGAVRLLGGRGDVADVLTAIDVAVTSSDAEASPLSVMEYMEAGRAIVATAVGGVPELLEDGVHGRLVPRRDPAAMAATISSLLDDPAARRRLGAAARERRRAEFGLDVMVGRVEELYERLYRQSTSGPHGRRSRTRRRA